MKNRIGEALLIISMSLAVMAGTTSPIPASASTATSTDAGVNQIAHADVGAVCSPSDVTELSWNFISRSQSEVPYIWERSSPDSTVVETGSGLALPGENVVIKTSRSEKPGDSVLSIRWGASRWAYESQFANNAVLSEDVSCIAR